ncbi:MAG: electron transfer flavoprotein beta subunit/FixA family protein [Actinomycetaceae bacterium]|nr:electron transfer flavoprotein beta subunit/FixA family protein [Actinomycetaceae bacterium]MDY6082886.1 electron transfer flavoprotein beta subunit/FixA family protein [Actinomycetaceae bacterium]
MTIVAAYKYASDISDVDVRRDASLDWTHARPRVSEYERTAIQTAHNLAAQCGVQAVGVSVGAQLAASSKAKQAALSAGLDRLILAVDDATLGWSATRQAAALASVVRMVDDAALVICGEASSDESRSIVPALLASALGWPVFENVTAIDVAAPASASPATASFRLTQQTSSGHRVIDLSGPAVISVVAHSVAIHVASASEIREAASRPVTVIPAASVDTMSVQNAVVSSRLPEPKERKGKIFAGPDAVDDLMHALDQDGVL